MVAAAVILVVIVVAGSVALAWGLRGWVGEESRLEAHLHAPETHTVSYAIPNGVDPVAVRAALTGAGFASAIETAGSHQAVRVECTESQRARVRHVIEDAHLPADGGADLAVRRVVFEDEH